MALSAEGQIDVILTLSDNKVNEFYAENSVYDVDYFMRSVIAPNDIFCYRSNLSL